MSVRLVSMPMAAAISFLVWLAPSLTNVAAAVEPPPGSVYELVTPPEANMEVEPTVDTPLSQLNPLEYEPITQYPFQSASDGSAIAFVADPAGAGTGSESSGWRAGNEYLARRTGDGWSVSNVTPDGAGSSVYEAFSPDLSLGVLHATEPLTPSAPGFGETPEAGASNNYDVLYTVNTSSMGGYEPLFTVKPPYRSTTRFGSQGILNIPRSFMFRTINGLSLVGASTDWTHLLFMANDALTGASEGRPAAEGGASSAYEGENNLYEAVNGQLRLVNVLPDGTSHAGAMFGGGIREETGYEKFNHVISSDGSKVFWTDLTTGHIYLRENGSTTVEISSAGKYQTASNDGSVVLYTNGDLYKYDTTNRLTVDLTPGSPVEKVIGTSEDASYIYYETTAGEFKLLHAGVSTTISAKSPGRADVTPDGRSVVYIATHNAYVIGPIEVYDADTDTVSCASCTESGSEGYLPTSNQENLLKTRWISADGSRVFFTSVQGLVPRDTNGLWDVYEWERAGTDKCVRNDGCLYDLTGGVSVDNSYFGEVSETGEDAFVVTRAQLAPIDENELFDVYDVRVNGTVTPTPPICSGTGCQGVPQATPIFATPASVTFEGVGNFAPTRPAVVQKKGNTKHKKARKPRKTKNRHKRGHTAKNVKLGQRGKARGNKGGQA